MAFPSRGFRRTRERASGLLFAFGVDDLSTSLVTGQALSFDRDSSRTVIDSTGRLTTLTRDQVPWSCAYNATDAVWEPTLDCQRAATNLCLQSEDLGTTWAAIGTPTRTAAAKRCGDLVLDLIGDDAAGTLEGYSQVVTYTGNEGKGVLIHMAAGTSTSVVVRVRDVSAGANRLLATIAWASGVPTVTMTTGTAYTTVTLADGSYQFQFRTTTVTAANTNQIEIYPATTSALVTTNTGTVYVGGVQTQNQNYCNAYIKTTTGTVTTDDDLCTTTLTAVPLSTYTIYARVARPARAGAASILTYTNQIMMWGTGGGGSSVSLSVDPVNLTAYVTLLDAVPAAASVAAALPASGVFDVCAQLDGVLTAPRVRIDIGSGFGSYSSTVAAITAWNNATLAIGSQNGASSALDSGIRRLVIASGARTLAEMRGLAV
jgi:hypothetical protein